MWPGTATLRVGQRIGMKRRGPYGTADFELDKREVVRAGSGTIRTGGRQLLNFNDTPERKEPIICS